MTPLESARWDLLYRSDYSERYHRRRSAFLTNFSVALSATTMVLGAASVGALWTSSGGLLPKYVAVAVTLMGTIQTVFRLSAHGSSHAQWMKRWSKLLADIRQNETPSANQIKSWTHEVVSIESECVGEMRALTFDCQNRSMKALSTDGSERYIGRIQKILIHFCSFQQNFPSLEERKSRAVLQRNRNVLVKRFAIGILIAGVFALGLWVFGPAHCRLDFSTKGLLICPSK